MKVKFKKVNSFFIIIKMYVKNLVPNCHVTTEMLHLLVHRLKLI